MSTDLVLLENQVAELENEDQQKFVVGKFEPFLQQVTDWEEKAKVLVVTSSLQRKEIREAKEARLALKRIRVGANKIREMLKRDALTYGKAVQSVYNVIEEKIKPLEEHLKLQEDFVEIQRAKVVAELGNTRLNKFIMEDWLEFVPPGADLGNMPVEDYEKLEKYCENQLAEKKEEAIRLVQEAADKLKLDDLEKKRRDELADYHQFKTDAIPGPVDIRTISDADYKKILAGLKRAKADHEAEQDRIKKENEKLLKENKKLKEEAVPVKAPDPEPEKVEQAVVVSSPPKPIKGKNVKASGGSWKVGIPGTVVTDDPTDFIGKGFNSGGRDDTQYYGGYLIAESILKPADAHLMSAAPDMYKVLKDLKKKSTDLHPSIVKLIDKALNKAEGKV